MEKIKSFKVDHLKLEKGIYLSREDGDVYTYDVRMRKPYSDPLLTNAELHSVEHILATVLRNGKHKDSVIYVGPMGCQTGFYIIFKGIMLAEAKPIIIDALKKTAAWSNDMPGDSKTECGYCLNLSVISARNAVEKYLSELEL